jgi:hypothetical protein
VPGGAHPVEQIGVGLDQGVADPGEDRVDRAGRDPRPEQLLTQLDDIAT